MHSHIMYSNIVYKIHTMHVEVVSLFVDFILFIYLFIFFFGGGEVIKKTGIFRFKFTTSFTLIYQVIISVD